MDPQIEELKEEVRRNSELTKDTNRMVHKIRRGVVWNRLFVLVWWLAIIAVSGAAYYYYAQPYVQKIEALYAQAQQGSAQAQSFGQKVSSFFAGWMPSTSTTTSTTTGQ